MDDWQPASFRFASAPSPVVVLPAMLAGVRGLRFEARRSAADRERVARIELDAHGSLVSGDVPAGFIPAPAVARLADIAPAALGADQGVCWLELSDLPTRARVEAAVHVTGWMGLGAPRTPFR